MPELETVNK